jgi:N6-adenosine-specific RNA methylase IME4
VKVFLVEDDDYDLATGMGYATRTNTEYVLLAQRGTPRRLNNDVHQVVMAPRREHSEKPEEVARRIERLYPGPYLELFARHERKGWTTWGNELKPYDGLDGFAKSLDVGYAAIR